MRLGRILVLGTLVVGCQSALGIEFEAYREGGPPPVDAGPGLGCIPNQTTRCLCGLDDGFQTCSETGHLAPCTCAKPEAGATDPVCGDGLVDTGEVCDDGNAEPGDGCDAQCVPDGRPLAVEACPGQSLTLWPGTDVQLDVTPFVRGSESDAGTCGLLDPPDRVYAIRATSAFEIEATSTAAFVYSLRTTCLDAASAQGCEAVLADGTSQVKRVEATEGQTYYLVIEPRQASLTAIGSLRLRSL
jgi:cysteine-rich repeat protein